MNHDPSTDPADARLAALYQAHVAQDGQPSAAADARILALAREAQARPAIRPVAPGWRSWLRSSWFGPGLAFATIASVSVVVVSLMPKEDMSVERAVAPAPVASSAESAATPPAAPVAGAKQAPREASKTTAVALASESARASSARGAPAAVVPAAPAVSAPPPAPAGPRRASAGSAAGLAESAAGPAAGAVSEARTAPVAAAPSAAPTPSVSNALSQRAEIAPAPAPARSLEQPNPFPAQSPVAGTGRSDKAAAAVAAADAGPAQSQEKTSLLSEPTESRLMANQAVPEVRDSAPTYPNEVKSSIPLPYTYTTPHPQPRIAVPGPAGTTGSMAGRPVLPQQYSAATRTEAAAEQSAPPAAAAAASTITTAAAPRVRDPAEWIKAIQKLRVEGKSEQVLKELAEFRRQYPAYALPDELKQLK